MTSDSTTYFYPGVVLTAIPLILLESLKLSPAFYSLLSTLSIMSYSPIISPAQAPATTEAPAIDYKTSYELLVEVSTETENKLEETEYKLDETEDELEETKQELFQSKQSLIDAEWKLDNTQHELEDLKQKLRELKAEMSQIDFLSTPQVDTATELQRLKQRALLKYNNLENTPDDESHHVGKAHLEYQAMVAAQETYLAFLSLPDECDGW